MQQQQYPYQNQYQGGQQQAVAVVSQQFCVPYPIELTVQKRTFSLSGGDFNVNFSNGSIALTVDGRAFSLRDKRIIGDTQGNPLITMRKKLLSIHDTWEAFRGENSGAGNLVFTAKKSMLFQLKTSINVYMAGNSTHLYSDFKVKGSYFDRSCTIYQGSRVIAEMRRKYTVTNVLLGRDTFAISVYPGIDYAFVVALVVILDEIHGNGDDG